MNIVKPESIAVFCLTPGGVRLARRLQTHLPLTCFTSEKLLEPGFTAFNGSFGDTLREAFKSYTALIVVGATGLTVRVIAPLVSDKMTDPAVVVIDEQGQHVISLLSGHVGGANALTRYLAGVLGAEPVITTATDVNQMAALDTLAVQLDAEMQDFRHAVKVVNHMLVSERKVGLWWDESLYAERARCDVRGFIAVESLDTLPQLDALVCVTLRDALPAFSLPMFKLVPRRVVAGIGCRRATSLQTLVELLSQQLAENHFDPLALRAIGSAAIKRDEPALHQLAQCWRVPFELFSVDELSPHEQRFPASEFVRRTVGVGSVSQPVAWLMSDGKLVGNTLRRQGVTITLGVSH
ncbi:cobalt-precorrin 5A hydrolase [Brenneria goodwinii]|uniref:cobalt-precorrin 5A hydrolase n=1 Tax=Brenneria goodwinii TaxID=1109412 RepID=UPI000EF22B20|nr:cobalt-precorrin 5A hydrolase [Brenneria goodwinii]MCG8158763.1 cobalt-precorrin 5A hydrolase [Brenneria goodwinii]MCG8163222.1 cobalt-precorrin 5A hydrolase [Brenneria goodwinii]MCG8167643.1 cobalt-precorrin 5A hydrolase [Brenneria goodwinii]MCG8170549.1 cobalt-precorrin 5A hydrolase [Brenneria goodwinii]MCG8174451.1 cobalt-precorrin 5A hydrolase [Brenneria goodwinii]